MESTSLTVETSLHAFNQLLAAANEKILEERRNAEETQRNEHRLDAWTHRREVFLRAQLEGRAATFPIILQ